ncbi:hypothetical protein [Actinoplanes ianthinogenes]|uniref:hypothetical protein n=1 Tax=Actinoplanes ianthinogenes TaxID=122358 RepID=UPI00166F7E03|nr:hypothetical protein [Actinoplanes ianthinogenes]
MGLIVAVLGRYGVAIPDDIRDASVEVIAIVGPLVAAYWARRHVTPTADPRDADGRPLVPAPTTASQDATAGGDEGGETPESEAETPDLVAAPPA